MTRITLINTIDDDALMWNKGARLDTITKKWTIDESQKSDPKFAKYLPTESQPTNDDFSDFRFGGESDDTEKQIKTYPEPVIVGISPEITSPEKQTKRTRGQIIDAEDSKIKKTYALSLDAISRCDRISKHFHMNLSSTIEKALKIAEQWIEENGKDTEIKKINHQNEQLLEVIRKTAKFEEIIDKQNREIEALKTASTKTSSTDIKNTNNQDYENIKELVNRIKEQTNIDIEEIREYVEKAINQTRNEIQFLDDRTGPMMCWFDTRENYPHYKKQWATKKEEARKALISKKEGGK